jgi:hypothetical protein
MTTCVTTEPYKKYLKKKHFLLEAQYNLNSKCCDEESCDSLITDLEHSAFKCDDLFREHHNVNEKGVITDESLCTDIRRQQNEIQEQMRLMSARRGGTNKKRRKSKSRRRKRKSRRSRRQKGYKVL